MSIFELGLSNTFGNNSQVNKGNYGTNFWGNKIFKFDGSLGDKKNLLISVKNIVRLLVGKNIPINYCSEGKDNSYTDGKQITISSIILPESLDSTVGLALHEASHIVKTNFDIIRNLIKKIDVPKKYHNHIKYIKNLHNWVEDRRIDLWAFNEAPGYKIYYRELYDRYFYNDNIIKIIEEKGDLLNLETGRNYQFFIFNSLHPYIKMDELKGLPEIKKILDIDNIQQLKSTKDTLNITYKIMDVILKNITSEEKNQINDQHLTTDEEILDELIKKILEMQESLGNDIPNDFQGEPIKIELNEHDSKVLEILIKSDTEIECVNVMPFSDNDKLIHEVITVNKIDEETIFSGVYSIFNTNKKIVEKQILLVQQGLSFGKMLGKRLKSRDDDRSEKEVRLKKGKIDNNILYSAGFGSSDIFYSINKNEFDDLNIHISVDLSFSMKSNKKWDKTLICTLGIAKAVSMVTNIRLQISLRYAGAIQNTRDEPIVILFYDSNYDHIKKLNLFKYVFPSGCTPEGLCYDALSKKIMKPLLNKDTIFINFSDGCPGMDGLSSETGVQITKKSIDNFRKNKIKILSYFISPVEVDEDSKSNFITMYGKESEFINVESILQVAKTLNKKILN